MTKLQSFIMAQKKEFLSCLLPAVTYNRLHECFTIARAAHSAKNDKINSTLKSEIPGP